MDLLEVNQILLISYLATSSKLSKKFSGKHAYGAYPIMAGLPKDTLE